MKRIKLVAIALGLLTLPGCTAGCQNHIKHMKSDVFGLDRTITVYDANGKAIKKWKTTAKLEKDGGFASFLDANGKLVQVSGTVIVEEN